MARLVSHAMERYMEIINFTIISVDYLAPNNDGNTIDIALTDDFYSHEGDEDGMLDSDSCFTDVRKYISDILGYYGVKAELNLDYEWDIEHSDILSVFGTIKILE